MQLQGKAMRVIIYIGENDHYEGKALYMALLQFLKKEGAAGATVVRGIAGFGAHSRIHTAAILDLSTDLPIRLEWIDNDALVERLLPTLKTMVNDGLITVEEVNVVQYAPGRRPDPLAQQVKDVMRTEVTAVAPDTPISEIVKLLLHKGYRSLPVLDLGGHPRGIITDGDLLRKAGLKARIGLHTQISPEYWQQLLAELRKLNVTAVDLMTSPVYTIRAADTLHHAVHLMIDHNLKRLPVVEEHGRLVGWISRVDILRTLEYHQPLQTMPAEHTPTGTTIADLMYRDVPTVKPQDNLEQILQALEKNRRRRAVVVDEDNRVLGIITDGDLLRRSQHKSNPGLLARLRRLVSGQGQDEKPPLLNAAETAVDLMSTPAFTISVNAPTSEALALMMRHGIKRLPVVDEDGRLVGLLGRASLLQGILAEAHATDNEE
jgi:CBS domain-containing protein